MFALFIFSIKLMFLLINSSFGFRTIFNDLSSSGLPFSSHGKSSILRVPASLLLKSSILTSVLFGSRKITGFNDMIAVPI